MEIMTNYLLTFRVMFLTEQNDEVGWREPAKATASISWKMVSCQSRRCARRATETRDASEFDRGSGIWCQQYEKAWACIATAAC